MKTIIVTELEMHEPKIRRLFFLEEEKVSRFLNPHEVKMVIANERAGTKHNLLWHGYKHDYQFHNKTWIFVPPPRNST